MADVVKSDNDQAERGSLLRRVSSGHYEHVDRSDSPNEEPSRTGATGSTTAVDGTSEGQGEEKERPTSKYAPRLRRAVRTLQHLKTFTSSYDFNRSGAGAEPGLDPHLADLQHLTAPLNVSIVQMNKAEVTKEEFRDKSADSLMEWIVSFDADAPEHQGKVTWINMNGLNGKVLQRLATKFQLHPLALEDAVHITRLSHSKANWYPDMLFVRLLTYEFEARLMPDDFGSKDGVFSKFRRFCHRHLLHSEDLEALKKVNGHGEGHLSRSNTMENVAGFAHSTSSRSSFAQPRELDPTISAHEVLQRLTSRFRVHLNKQQLSIFLTASGVVLSVFSGSGADLLAPIYDRLGTPGTTLRTSEDPSMILHGLIDVAVDELMEIAEEFRFQLDVLEGQALLKPDPLLVRHLHVLSSQLLMLKRSITPIHSLVRALKIDDERRSVAAIKQRQPSTPPTRSETKSSIVDEVPGHLSPGARLYLQDIEDHLEALVESIELFSSRASALVDWNYNQMSFDSNAQISILTLSTVFFLPLTLVTGIFGMNFEIFPEVGHFSPGHQPSGPNPSGHVAFFWEIMAGLIAAMVLLFGLAKLGPNLGIFGLKLINRKQERLRNRLNSPHI